MDESDDGFKRPAFLNKKPLQLDDSDMSISQSQSFEVSLNHFTHKKLGIKIGTNGVDNININPEEIEVKEQIGYGTGGSVHLAIHTPSETKLAIKSVNIFDKDKRHQLLNELSGLHISNDYLVQFFGAYYDDGRVRLILEFMDCGSLRSFMEAIKSLYPEQFPLLPEFVISKS